MLEVRAIRTFAINAKVIGVAEKFYTQALGGEVIRRIEPTEEQLKRGRVKEVHVRLGNIQVHIFDAFQGPRPGVPHHTILIPWMEKEKRIQGEEKEGTKVENTQDHPDEKGCSLSVKDPDGNIWELWSAP